jgi:predicted AlkP superfamily pyrophosphatase or phosphodiesterase
MFQALSWLWGVTCRRSTRRLVRLLGVLALMAFGIAALRPSAAVPPGRPAEGRLLTIFLIDGLSQPHFETLERAGRLPNLSRLKAEGAYVRGGISAFPSMTGYGFYPFLTGRDASTSGLLGLRWFDRRRSRGQIRNYVGGANRHMNTDLVPVPPTLFERVAPDHTFAINALVDRGVRHKVITGWDFTMAKYGQSWWLPRWLRAVPSIGPRLVPDLAEAERRVLAAAVADLAYRPKIQWVGFTSPDAHAHIHGMNAGYDALLETVDGLIGAYRAQSRARGEESRRVYAVLPDHGLVGVQQNVDLRVRLSAVGVRVDREEAVRVFDDRLDDDLTKRLRATDVVLLVNGNSLNYLYVRNPRADRDAGDFLVRVPREELRAFPVPGRAPVDLIATLLATEGVDMVLARDRQGNVFIHSRNGQARIDKTEAGFVYEPLGEDPLGYSQDPRTAALIDGAPHGAAAWLDASAHTQFPDAIYRVHALLENPGCGDLVVLAKAGFDLAADYERFVLNYRGGHGGLRADELRVPYILAGPGIAAGVTVPVARAEDVGATLATALSLPLLEGAEGHALVQALTAR